MDMDTKNTLVAEIVEREWKMFQGVNSIGGRASCQDDRKTFDIMRSSQAMSWSVELLASYIDDLKAAEECGRNLVSEKYARMMESTSPLEYAQIKHLLPPIDPDAKAKIEQIVEISISWEEEASRRYPNVVARGRPLRSAEDNPWSTSVETYLRGELSTYSPNTIALYSEYVEKQVAGGINGAELTLEHTAKQYGFKTLQEANERLCHRS